MQKNLRRYFVALIICAPLAIGAQEQQRFANMDEANQAERFWPAGRGRGM